MIAFGIVKDVIKVIVKIIFLNIVRKDVYETTFLLSNHWKVL